MFALSAPDPPAHAAPPPRAEPRWWNRLGVRLTLAIAFVTLATTSVLLVLVVRAQQRHLTSLTMQATELLSDTVRSSMHYDMLLDRREEAYNMLQSVGHQAGVDRVRIFNKEGRITFSTDTAERDTYVDKGAESCYACHAANQPIVRPNLTSRVRIFERDSHRVLAMVTPIYNEPSCSNGSCHVHPPTQRVLGVVDLSVSLQPIDQQARELRATTFAVGTLALIASALVITFFVRRSVLRPVSQLIGATRRLARGELGYRLPLRSHDEFRELEQSFNEMGESLGAARAERLRLLESLEQQVEQRTADLRRAQEQLVRSEKLSSLGRLAASIAHEINNPLAGILTYAKLLIRTFDDPATPEPQRTSAVKQLKLVQRETERCSAIVRNLLDFARERPLDQKNISVNQVLEEALALVSNQARLGNIELVKTLGDVPPVLADFGQIRQAFINLLINACDAMPTGGRLAITTRRGSAPREMVEIAIADSGCGIPKENLSKVLDPFFTTKDKGTGLGLSVVYGIVERHGGVIDLASEVGVGTTVTIRLPAAPVPEKAEPEVLAGAAAGTAKTAGSGAWPLA